MTFLLFAPTPGASRAALILLAGALAAGCSKELIDVHSPGFNLSQPAQRHPILVSEKPTTLSVVVPKGSSGLAPKARADLLDFASRSRASDAGDSRMIIQAPSGSANEVAAMNAVQQIRGILFDSGYNESGITVEAFDAGGDQAPAVTVSYTRFVAQGPECANWAVNVAYEPQNLPMTNAGCANQRNLAAMVANPADLLGPRSMTPRSGERRDVTWEKYQKGTKTASEKNEDGRVSTRSQGDN